MKTESDRFQDAFDAILKWYKSDGSKPLPPELEERRMRWIVIREWIVTMKPLTDTETVRFATKRLLISEPMAWRDVRDTKRFFASMEVVDKEFERIMLKAQITSLRAEALAARQYKVVAQCDANLSKLGQFDQPTKEGEGEGKQIILNVDFNPARIGAKPIPNLLEQVERFIGEKAKRELMIDDDTLDGLSDGDGTD